MPTPHPRLRLLLAATALKLALAPAYRSTDFEVHRNWLAVTAGRPVSAWYEEATSAWTLDYPPLFAWFQRGLAVAAARLAPEALTLSATPVASPAITAFQRGSVIATDSLLAAAAALVTSPLPAPARSLTFGLLVAGPGLLLLDHIHFQYNGWLTGLLILAVAASAAGGGGGGGGGGIGGGGGSGGRPARSLALTAAGAGGFAALVCSKHLFAAAGPVFAVYFALLALRAPGGAGGKALAASAVGLPVAAVLAAALLPLYASGGAPALRALASRLAPLDRGLVHAYWAPNAWALLAGADGACAAVAKRVVRRGGGGVTPLPLLSAFLTSAADAAAAGAGAFASGLVRVTRFACFPTPGPAAAAGAALAAQAPALAALLASPSPARPGLLLPAVEFAGLGAAAWGYHVHEKAAVPYVLLAAVGLGVSAAVRKGGKGGQAPPLALAIPPPPRGGPVAALAADPAHYATLSLASYHALLPLIHGSAEWGVRTGLVAAHAVVALGVVPAVFGGGAAPSRLLRSRAAALAALLAGTEVAASVLHPLLLGPDRLPFLPLAATSLACAVGLVGEWGLAAVAWGREAVEGRRGSSSTAAAAARRKRRR